MAYDQVTCVRPTGFNADRRVGRFGGASRSDSIDNVIDSIKRIEQPI